jgi:hypothetical protein
MEKLKWSIVRMRVGDLIPQALQKNNAEKVWIFNSISVYLQRQINTEEMNKKERIKELEEYRRLLLHDLKMTIRIEEKIGNTPHLEEARNLYLDQLNEIERELKKLE